jgi:hypothetical protein
MGPNEAAVFGAVQRVASERWRLSWEIAHAARVPRRTARYWLTRFAERGVVEERRTARKIAGDAHHDRHEWIWRG